MMKFPIFLESLKFMFQTTNQPSNYLVIPAPSFGLVLQDGLGQHLPSTPLRLQQEELQRRQGHRALSAVEGVTEQAKRRVQVTMLQGTAE
jgi:hypothetical protein